MAIVYVQRNDGLCYHRFMTAATKQAQHDPHWTGNRFITGGRGEELDHARRPMVF